MYPKRIPDLFAARPVVVTARYDSPGRGAIWLRGKLAGAAFSHRIPLVLPEHEDAHDVLAALWARARVDDLMGQDYLGIQQGSARADIREAITELGLSYRLLTQFTSFVAVEEMTLTTGGEPRRVEVPVEMPEGVSCEGVFGERKEAEADRMTAAQVGFQQLQAPAANIAATALPHVMKERDAAGRMDSRGSKLYPSLEALAARYRRGDRTPVPGEANFVKGGRATVQVWLADVSPETLALLRGLGMEILLQPKTAKTVIGRLAVEKLRALSELKAVIYVVPA